MDNQRDLLLRIFSHIFEWTVTLHQVNLVLHYKKIGGFVLKKLICIILLTLAYSFPSAATNDNWQTKAFSKHAWFLVFYTNAYEINNLPYMPKYTKEERKQEIEELYTKNLLHRHRLTIQYQC